MNSTQQIIDAPFRCVEPNGPLSRAMWVNSPKAIAEVRLGGWVEVFVGPNADPAQKELIVCGHVVWIDIAENAVVMRVDDEVQNPQETGLHNGDFIRVRLEEILASEFSRERVFATALDKLFAADESLLHRHGFYTANPKFDPTTPKWKAELAAGDGAAYYTEFLAARQLFLNRLAMDQAIPGTSRMRM